MGRLSVGLFLIVIFLGVASAVDVMEASVDIYVPQEVVSIEIPDYVYLGNLTYGFDVETERVRIDINNTGTVNVSIQPLLMEEDVTGIFENLKFARRLNDGFSLIGAWFLDIGAPDSFGGKEAEYFYMKLDLSNYTGNLDSDLIDHRARIGFVAVSNE